MKKNLFLVSFFLISISLFGQTTPIPSWIKSTVYIDPTYTGDEDGTMVKPFKSNKSAGFSWKARTAYLFKRNTKLNANTQENITVDSVIIGSYGTGDKPILSYIITDNTTMSINITGQNVYVNDIYVKSQSGVNGINVRDNRCTINNCIIDGGYKGINGFQVKHLTVKNTEIFNTVYDAMNVLGQSDTVIVTNCYMHDQLVLPDKSNDQAIDNLHMETIHTVIIDSLRSDHSNFPGKFCLILNGCDSVFLSNSKFIGHPGNACVYAASDMWIIKNCYFEGGTYGIQNHSNLKLYNCVFNKQIIKAVDSGFKRYFYNCTFVNQLYAIHGWAANVEEMRNCIFYNFNMSIWGNMKQENITNNLYFKKTNYDMRIYYGKDSIVEDPMFIDTANYDFRLKPNSPCINKGLVIPGNSVDFSGTSRVGLPDIGAFEYVSDFPNVYDVTTTATGCEYDTASIKLSNSDVGVRYTLRRNSLEINNYIDGTGNAIDFGKPAYQGIYSVVAVNKSTKATSIMKGTHKILTKLVPNKQFVIGGGYYNYVKGGAEIKLYSSEKNIEYQLYRYNSPEGSPIVGTGDSISFGIQSQNGIYTAIALNKENNCSRKMPNSVLIEGNTGINVSVSASEGGTISNGAPLNVASGTVVNFTAVSKEGYKFLNWKVNGVVDATSTPIISLTINSSTTVIANFEAVPLEVTSSAEANGTVTSSANSTVFIGTTVTFTATPNQGYVFDKWTVNGEKNTTLESTLILVISAKTNVVASFKAIKHTVSASASTGGVVSNGAQQTVDLGTSITFNAAPNPGYGFASWVVNGVADTTTSPTLNLSVSTNTVVLAIFYKLNATGINSDISENLKVYPTLVSNVFNIEHSSKILSVKVLSMNGFVVASQNVNDLNVSINVSTWKTGPYFVKVITNEGVLTRKIVVVR